jgi:hypothetical protein
MPKLQLPEPTRINGRLFFERHQLENAKREVLGLPLLPRDPAAVIELVPAPRAAVECGKSRLSSNIGPQIFLRALGSRFLRVVTALNRLAPLGALNGRSA